MLALVPKATARKPEPAQSGKQFAKYMAGTDCFPSDQLEPRGNQDPDCDSLRATTHCPLLKTCGKAATLVTVRNPPQLRVLTNNLLHHEGAVQSPKQCATMKHVYPIDLVFECIRNEICGLH